MPRSTPNRTIGGDRTVAQRVAEEREARDWTYEVLSRRMEEAGCPIHISALHKLEKGHPPRRVTVDELVAFSNVFGVGVEELVVPSALRKDRRLRRLVEAWWDAREAVAAARRGLLDAETALRAHLSKHPDSAGELERSLEQRAARYAEDVDDAQGVAAELSLLLTRGRVLARHEQDALDRRGTGEA